MNSVLDCITSEDDLDRVISEPPAEVVEMMKRIDGDIAVLGIAGKIGINLGMMAVNAIRAAGVKKRVIGVARFSDADAKAKLERAGVETIKCDLLDRDAVALLPRVKNVIFMAGRKFGTGGSEALTWAMNVVAPVIVCNHFKGSRFVVYSTGCVYDFVSCESGGSTETDTPRPVGDYAQSALGRERVFSYYASAYGSAACLLRLNYAIDLRYGVLHDIAVKVDAGEPIDLMMGYVNVIWQGDVVAYSLRCLEHASTSAEILNITGPETLSVRWLAEELGERLGKKPTFTNSESPTAYLNNASKAFRLLGAPRVDISTMLDWTAKWTAAGGRSLGKPTHFESKDGQY